MTTVKHRSGFAAAGALFRAGLALLVGLYIDFVALTFVAPLWETTGSRGEFALGLLFAALLSFGNGCLIALIAGAYAIPVCVVAALGLGVGGLATSEELSTGLLLMVVLPASIVIGALLVRRRAAVRTSQSPTAAGKSSPVDQ